MSLALIPYKPSVVPKTPPGPNTSANYLKEKIAERRHLFESHPSLTETSDPFSPFPDDALFDAQPLPTDDPPPSYEEAVGVARGENKRIVVGSVGVAKGENEEAMSFPHVLDPSLKVRVEDCSDRVDDDNPPVYTFDDSDAEKLKDIFALFDDESAKQLKSLDEFNDPVEYLEQFPRCRASRIEQWVPWPEYPEQFRKGKPIGNPGKNQQKKKKENRSNCNYGTGSCYSTNATTSSLPKREGPGISGTGQIDGTYGNGRVPTPPLKKCFSDFPRRYFNHLTLEKKIENAMTMMNRECDTSKVPPVKKCGWKVYNEEFTISEAVLKEFDYVLPDAKELGRRMCGTEYAQEYIRLWEACIDYYEIYPDQLVQRKVQLS